MEGFDIEWVLDLDILSFDSLIGSIHRIQSQEKVEGTWLQRYAMQAEHKDFKKAMQPYEKAMTAGTEKPKPAAKGAKDFIRKHGRGI